MLLRSVLHLHDAHFLAFVTCYVLLHVLLEVLSFLLKPLDVCDILGDLLLVFFPDLGLLVAQFAICLSQSLILGLPGKQNLSD